MKTWKYVVGLLLILKREQLIHVKCQLKIETKINDNFNNVIDKNHKATICRIHKKIGAAFIELMTAYDKVWKHVLTYKLSSFTTCI